MRASVVIPTYNRVNDLRNVLAALYEQDTPPGVVLEVVVVDDGSSDGTWDIVNNWKGMEHHRLQCEEEEAIQIAEEKLRAEEHCDGTV